jgi:hypothetical protein
MKYIKQFSAIKFLVLLFLELIFFSCNHPIQNNTFSSAPFRKAIAYYNIKNISNWKLYEAFKEKNGLNIDGYKYSGGFYYYKKTINDTIYWLAFEYYFNNNDTIFFPREFYKRYEDDYFQYVSLYGKNGDILFSYKAALFGRLTKIFITGKYFYQYFCNELNSKQHIYFIMNKDSLKKIRGHNLPKLPEADEKTIKVFQDQVNNFDGFQ